MTAYSQYPVVVRPAFIHLRPAVGETVLHPSHSVAWGLIRWTILGYGITGVDFSFGPGFGYSDDGLSEECSGQFHFDAYASDFLISCVSGSGLRCAGRNRPVVPSLFHFSVFVMACRACGYHNLIENIMQSAVVGVIQSSSHSVFILQVTKGMTAKEM